MQQINPFLGVWIERGRCCISYNCMHSWKNLITFFYDNLKNTSTLFIDRKAASFTQLAARANILRWRS